MTNTCAHSRGGGRNCDRAGRCACRLVGGILCTCIRVHVLVALQPGRLRSLQEPCSTRWAYVRARIHEQQVRAGATPALIRRRA
eukprot:6080747-Pleurochrysis_carterae.AAC.1